MELHDAIRRRRMVRSFTAEPVDAAALDRILSVAVRAPSAGFSQGWAHVVLEGPAQTGPFWDLTVEAGWRARTTRQGKFAAPVVIVSLCSADRYVARYNEADKAAAGLGRHEDWPVPYWTADTAMAAMLMLLAVVDEGLGALWSGVFRGEAALLAHLGVPADEGWSIVGALAIGHPADGDRPSSSLRRGRREVDEVVHRGRW